MHTKASTIRMLTLSCAKNGVDSEVLFGQLHVQAHIQPASAYDLYGKACLQ